MGVMLCGLRGTANASGRLFDAAQETWPMQEADIHRIDTVVAVA